MHTIVSSQNQQSLLFFFIKIISHPNPSLSSTFEEIFKYSCKVLTESIRQPSSTSNRNNQNTTIVPHTHSQIIQFLLNSIPESGFISNPFSTIIMNQQPPILDDSIIRDIVTLASTIAIEQIDDIALGQIPGSLHLIEILIQAQSHPNSSLPTAINTLEVWLSLQDIPTADRHEYFSKPLFQKLLKGLSTKIQYTSSFISWEEECDDLDVQEFNEFRRLVKDVLISCYFLLRADFIQDMGDCIIAVATSSSSSNSEWYTIESALFCICAAGREICARVKARGGSQISTIATDKDATIQKLMQLAQILFSHSPKNQHPMVLASIAQYLGTFAPVWNVCDDVTIHVLLKILQYLKDALSIPAACHDAAQSIKRILVACSSKLLPTAITTTTTTTTTATTTTSNLPIQNNLVLSTLPTIMEGAFLSHQESCLKAVAEGCTRLIVQIKTNHKYGKDDAQSFNIIKESLQMISEPVLLQTQRALTTISTHNIPETQLVHATITISITLRVMNEIIRFCDLPSPSSAHPLSNVLNLLWPILNAISNSPICRKHDDILTDLLCLQSRIFSTVPTLVAPHLAQLITFVVQAYEETYLPCTLDCVAVLVEVFGGMDTNIVTSFNQLLTHLIQCTCRYVTQTKAPHECTKVR